MVEQIIKKLEAYQPASMIGDVQERQHAAVLLPIVLDPKPMLIFTERAAHMDSHAGEVAWPGGKQDPGDQHLQMTALRETNEEIGLPVESIKIITELRPFISKFGLLVTPYVGLVEGQAEFHANPDEIASIFKVPIAWFENDPRSATDVVARHGETHVVPVYHYEGYRIWGLTAMILAEFLTCVLGEKFPRG